MRLATLITLLVAGAGVTIAYARTGRARPYLPGDTVIKGTFVMKGVITQAVNVPGERPGEHIRRTWIIHPVGCATSACRWLQVVRNRGDVKDSYVELRRTGPGRYQGSGAFWVGLQCLGRRYRLGSRAPYTITLRVTSRRRIGSVLYATAVRATYSNSARSDGTPCRLDPTSDAASYNGRLTSRLPAPPRHTTTTHTTTTTTGTMTTITSPGTTPTGTTTTGTTTTGTTTTSTDTTTTGTITTP